MFDHSVRSDAIRAEHGVVKEVGELWGKPYTYLRHHTQVRPPRNDWRQDEIDSLQFIANLIRNGSVFPFTTAEMEAEAFRVLKCPSLGHEDIFAEFRFEYLEPPIDRSKWGLSIEQHLSKEDVIAYCECFFLSPSADRTEAFIDGMRSNPCFSLTGFEERCLRRLDVFKRICRGIDRTHYPDALHLWTAEENSVDVFLTMDKRFRNVIQRQKADLHCRILFPSELKSQF
ncbi:hypothetical protein [Pelagibius sp.]|uniref:hypothetical protein n=1 Tax=Pelagibius sp. TaxID=1931238 RepID=UPI0026228809|nr:hypothetical protein [Pelagibius sp.]